uniref:Uncharacterized protein n=1 Tax=Salix viminalis TaxID=40686 RepID=A0A6N2JYQ1_SALVM
MKRRRFDEPGTVRPVRNRGVPAGIRRELPDLAGILTGQNVAVLSRILHADGPFRPFGRDADGINNFVTPNSHRVTEVTHAFSNEKRLIFVSSVAFPASSVLAGLDERTRAYKKMVDFRGVANKLSLQVVDCLKTSELNPDKSANIDPLTADQPKKSNDYVNNESGDPNLHLHEIGIPCHIAERLQDSESLTAWNWEKLSACFENDVFLSSFELQQLHMFHPVLIMIFHQVMFAFGMLILFILRSPFGYGTLMVTYFKALEDIVMSVSLSDFYLCPDSYSRKNMMDEILSGLLDADYTCNLKHLMVDSCRDFLTDERTRAYKKMVDFRGVANKLSLQVVDCLKTSELNPDKSANIDPLTADQPKKSNDYVNNESGDPNLHLHEIGIPCHIAERLQDSESLTAWNWEKLSACFENDVFLSSFELQQLHMFHPVLIMHVCIRNVDLVYSEESFWLRDTDGNLFQSLGRYCHGQVLDFLMNGPGLQKMVDFRGVANKLSLQVVDCLKTSELNPDKSANIDPLTADQPKKSNDYVNNESDPNLHLHEIAYCIQNLSRLGIGRTTACDSCAQQLNLDPSANACVWTGKQLISLLRPVGFDHDFPSSDVCIRNGPFGYGTLMVTYFKALDDIAMVRACVMRSRDLQHQVNLRSDALKLVFRDIQSLISIQKYASQDNSLLAMFSAGSKLRMPRQLPCAGWNKQIRAMLLLKVLFFQAGILWSVLQVEIVLSVTMIIFLGLNLFRRIMFFMRDLHGA